MNEKDLLEHIVRSDISVKDGYSYNDIVSYLSFLKKKYLLLHQKNSIKEERIEGLIIALDSKEKEINKREEIIELKKKEIENLKKVILKKMTLKERLLGRIKL